MGDKETFPQRIEALRLIPEALEEVRVHVPILYEGQKKGTKPHVIPNAPGKQGSLQVYAAITSNDGYIDGQAAQKGLTIFGQDLRADARTNPGKHPNIDLLETIAETGDKVRSDVIRRNSDSLLPERIAELIPAAVKEFGTPFILLDGTGIRQTLREMNAAFSWNPGFREFYAVKAFPNPSLLKLMADEGAGADCSEYSELGLAHAAGIYGEKKILTANDVSPKVFRRAKNLGAIINFDDLTDIEFFEKNVGDLPQVACVRYNPGEARLGNSLIGNPVEAKYGMTRSQVLEAFKLMKKKGVERFGLHTMIASNELNPAYHIETARMLFDLALEAKIKLGIDVEFVNTGGGWGVGYRPEQRQINPAEIGEGVRSAYKEIVEDSGLNPLNVFMENGRFVTGPHGWLVARVMHEKHIFREYLGVDSSASDFARPAAYGSYHHAIILGKQDAPHNKVYDVTGSLCENCDKFAVNRALPQTRIGDLFVLCGAGAHGRAMGSNYNAKLRCKELMEDRGQVTMIRRAETEKDYFATLDFPGSEFENLSR